MLLCVPIVLVSPGPPRYQRDACLIPDSHAIASERTFSRHLRFT